MTYQGCQSPFRGGEQPPITSQGSPKEEMTMGREIGVSLAQGLDVSNFLKDVPRVPKFVSE